MRVFIHGTSEFRCLEIISLIAPLDSARILEAVKLKRKGRTADGSALSFPVCMFATVALLKSRERVVRTFIGMPDTEAIHAIAQLEAWLVVISTS